MKDLLISIVCGLIGFAIALLAFGEKFDVSAAVFGTIGVAAYVAIEAGKRRGIRDTEFGSDSRETEDG